MTLRNADCGLRIGMRIGRIGLIGVMALVLAGSLRAQQPQTVQDEYAMYELLAPDTASFTTVYDVAVTTPGATTFFDRIGSGLQPVGAASGSGDVVRDLMTGEPLSSARRSAARRRRRMAWWMRIRPASTSKSASPGRFRPMAARHGCGS
jgi:hypothetical protein